MKNFKKFNLVPMIGTLGLAGLFLVACGDDSSSTGSFSMDESFEVILSKVNYDYKSKDSLFILKKPECKESSLGYLVWNQEADKRDTLEASLKNTTLRLRDYGDKGWYEYKFEGRDFPKGLFYEGSLANEKFRYATRIDGKQFKEVYQFNGSCFMKNYYKVLFENNEAMAEADNALTKFYQKFTKDGNAKERQISDDVKAPTCNELSLFDGDVIIKVDYLKESSGQISLKYSKSDDCPISFTIRYANNESDCSAAYDDFSKEKYEDEKFDFSKYSMSVDYSTYCIERLVLEFKKETGILTKQAADDESVSTDAIARAAVNVILDGLKK
ncbi:MAG: hypothetical protein MJZ10_02250 [Fibrobacter sp.]|nr:hypothetical protein [Fibrobacter sp.]